MLTLAAHFSQIRNQLFGLVDYNNDVSRFPQIRADINKTAGKINLNSHTHTHNKLAHKHAYVQTPKYKLTHSITDRPCEQFAMERQGEGLKDRP